MPTSAALPERPRLALALTWLGLLLPLLVFGVVAGRAYDRAFAAADQRAERTARIAQEHAAKVLDTNGVLIGRIEDMLRGLDDREILAREPELHRRLVEFARSLPQIQSIWVQDARGRPLVTDRFLPAPRATLDVSDRDYFKWHRDGRGGLYISEPGVGKATGTRFFDTSRRRDGADGSFAGLVSVSLFPDFFSAFYLELVGKDDAVAVTLFRQDGTVLARHPVLPQVAARSAAEGPLMRAIQAGRSGGTLSMPSTFDSQMRRIAFRVVPGYPLFIGVGIRHDTIVAAWRQDMLVFAALFFPTCGLLGWAAWSSLRRARREREAYQQLQREVLQREKAERALLQTQKLEALGQLTGSVAHDVNNLLAVVSNSAHLIERAPPGHDIRPTLAAIRRAVDAGSQLTRQLLSISRRRAVQVAALDVAGTLRGALDLLRSTVGRRIEVVLELAEPLPSVRADAAELQLALINLAINARDAMPDGGQLRIEARAVSAANWPGTPPREGVEIAVTDTGTGIAPEVEEYVFEPFFTTKPAGQGTGLGLAQVRGACEQAGGLVRLQTAPGRGTTVRLFLPSADTSADERRSDLADLPERLDGELLLVEDNADLAIATEALLASYGLRVVRAAQAEEALEALAARGRPFDVVLSDVVMPGTMNGLALARALQAQAPGMPVLLMTGYTSELQAAVAAGYDVLPKPCQPGELMRRLRQVLSAARV